MTLRRAVLATTALAAAGLLALSPLGGALIGPAAGSATLDESCTEVEPARPAAPPAPVRERLEDLHARFDHLPDFLDVYLMPDRSPSHVAVFVGDVPDKARQVETPVPVAMRSIPSLPETASPTSAPSQGDILCNDGIRPGAMLDTGCTLAFIYKNTTDGDTDYYATTAGHCYTEGSSAAIPGVGQFGRVVFSTGPRGPGDDYAVIKVYEIFEGMVNGKMCSVGGPTAQNEDPILGERIVHTGYGQGVGFPGDNLLPPRPRTGVGTIWGAETFGWYGAGIPGDSGSAVRLGSGEALGVLTHLGGTLFGTNVGTTWFHGLHTADKDPAVPDADGMTLVTADTEV